MLQNEDGNTNNEQPINRAGTESRIYLQNK